MTNAERWTEAAFHADVTDWVRARCREAGIVLTGTWEQPHCRPWSSTIRFDTDRGALWFKVNGSGTRYEPALLAALSRFVPDLVPELLAVDTARGWSLCRDAGPLMRSVAPATDLWPHWERVLPRYAAAQIELSNHRDVLLATGIRHLSPHTLPTTIRTLHDELARTAPDEGGLTPAQSRALTSAFGRFDAWCAELASSAIPDSLQHDDLHSANICWPGAGARVIDWGDASWSTPIGTMVATLNSVTYHAATTLDDLRVVRVRDAYLAPFTAFATHAELVHLVGVVRRVGALSRALSYRAALEGEPPASHAAYEFPVRERLMEIAER